MNNTFLHGVNNHAPVSPPKQGSIQLPRGARPYISKNGDSKVESFEHSASPTNSSKAGPAHKLLCSVGDWDKNAFKMTPISRRAFVMDAYGYKNFAIQFADTMTTLVLAASAPSVIELHTLISYPDRRGGGSTAMERLCALADELGVIIWLDAYPFGRNRDHIPFSKLVGFYHRFQFFGVARIDRGWINEFHRWDHRAGFARLMLRNPRRS